MNRNIGPLARRVALFIVYYTPNAPLLSIRCGRKLRCSRKLANLLFIAYTPKRGIVINKVNKV